MATDIQFPNPLHGSRHSPGGPDPIPGIGGGGTAATTTFTPAGNISATNVQAAIAELDTEKQAALPAGGTTAQFLRGDKTWRTFTTELGVNNVEVDCKWNGTTYVRPNYAGPVNFIGATPPALRTDGVTTGGDNQAVQGLDAWTQTS